MGENYTLIAKSNGKVLAVLLFFITSLSINAQSNLSCGDYVVTRSTGITYNSIIASGGGNAFNSWRNVSGSGPGGSYDDNRSNPENIGFDFWYLGVRYTSLCVSTNGFIDFSASAANGTGTSSYGYQNTVFSSSGNPTLLTIAPYYDDQVIGGNVDGLDSLGNYIQWQLQGIAPNRTFTIEWYQMTQYSSIAANLNYQVVLHESTGIIQFNYGSMNNGALAWSYSSGLNGINMGAAPTVKQLLTQQTANTATFNNTPKNNLAATPTSSTSITFTPPTPTGNPFGLTFTGLLQTGVTLNWNDNATNEAGYVIYYSPDNVTFTFNSQTAANATSSVIAGLLPGTNYYWQIYAVTDGDLSTVITGSCVTNPATVVTSTVTGNWNTPGTWDCNCVPNTNDKVTVADGTVVTINGASPTASCYSLTVGQGASGSLIMGSNATAITLTVTGGMMIKSGGSFTTENAANATHTIIMGGNIINNGTLNLFQSATKVTNVTFDNSFYNSGYQSISGTGATTTFNNITLNMGNSNANIVEVLSTNFSAAANFLTLNNGTFKLSTGATITPFNVSTTISTTAGFWVNNAGATVNSAAAVTIALQGYIHVTAGTMNIGGAVNNNLSFQGGTLTMDGGNLIVAGCINNTDVTAITNFTMSSGTITVAGSGVQTTAGVSPFDIENGGSTFNMTGGTIIIRNPGAGNLGYTCIGFSGSIFSGGTLQIGDASTAAGKTIQINTSDAVYNLVVSNGVATTAQLSTNSLIVGNNITINSGTLNSNALNITLAGNWANSGAFTASTGTVTFNGSGAGGQTISGSTTTTFGNLTINNTGATGVSLSTGANVSNSLALTSGLLNTTTTNTLTMQSGSTAPALTSASTSYVNGPMVYQKSTAAKQTLNFPIGTSPDCRPFYLTVTHTTANLYNYTAQLYNASSFSAPGGAATYTNYPATVDTLSGVHYYSIARTNSVSVSTPTLELSGNQQIQMFFGANDQVYDGGLLTVCKTYTNTTDWVDIGQSACSIGALQFAVPQVGSITSSLAGPTAFNSFSYFTLGRLLGAGKNPLPIQLLTFNAVPNGEKVDITWETAIEQNNAYFTIEKSKDGVNFTKLIDVPGAGNSTTYKNYAETDYQPYTGTSYYRLKQTDYNNNYKYFNIVPVNFNGVQQSIIVCPNPIIANTTGTSIKLVGYQNQEVIVVLRDIQGREFLTTVLLTVDTDKAFKVDGTESLPAGTYIVTASSNDKIYNYKLLVR